MSKQELLAAVLARGPPPRPQGVSSASVPHIKRRIAGQEQHVHRQTSAEYPQPQKGTLQEEAGQVSGESTDVTA